MTRRMVCLLCATLLVGALAAAAPAHGQTELVVDAGVGAFAGGDFKGLGAGPSLAAALHVADWSRAHGGVELGLSRHGGHPFESATTQVEILVLARVTVLSGPVSLHAGGKMGVARRTLRRVGDPARTEGFVMGPSAAARTRVAGTVVQLSLDVLYESFEELTMYGTREYGTDEDGARLAVRLGVVLPIARSPNGQGGRATGR